MIILSYNNCGNSIQTAKRISFDTESGTFNSVHGDVDAPTGNGSIKAFANTKTVSLINANRALDSLVSCLGTEKPSSKAKEEWQQNKGAISAEGDANSLTAPMLAALLKVSAEVCNDLVSIESGLPDSQRRIFAGVNFSGGPASIDNFLVGDITRRLARSCWGRNERENELDQISETVDAAFSGAANNSSETSRKLVFLCTMVAGSFQTFSM